MGTKSFVLFSNLFFLFPSFLLLVCSGANLKLGAGVKRKRGKGGLIMEREEDNRGKEKRGEDENRRR